MAGQVCLEISLPRDVLSALHSENGPHETFEFLILIVAFFVAVTTFKYIDWKRQKWLAVWIGLAAVCCFYVAGEEISWGQHFLKWSTPESWSQINDQGETNLHNMSSWFDQKPRLLLLIGVVFGGLVLPLLNKYKPQIVPEKFSMVYPPETLALIAGVCLLVHVVDDVDSAIDSITLFERASEIEELYMFYFVLLYLIVIKRRLTG